MPTLSRFALLSALLATIPAVAAPAQETDEVFDLDTISVTAASEPVRLSQTGAAVTVLTAPDLAAAPLSFSSLLATQPGISLSANGGLGTQTALRLRGLPAYYLGTRIDGMDVTDPSSTQLSYNFGPLLTTGLSRVEILRGAQSALYGSEAAAGVVDVTTWRPEEEGRSGALAVEAGTYGTYAGTASVGYRDARTELALSFGRAVSEGFSAHSAGSEKDGFRGSQISASARHALSETLTLGATVLAQDSLTDFDSSTGDADNWTDSQLRGARVFVDFSTGTVTHELSYARVDVRRDVYEYASHTYFDATRETLAYDGRWDAGGPFRLSWGAEHKTEDFSVASAWSTTVGDITTDAVYAEALWAPRDDLDLALALRHDDHEMFGAETTARLALAWRPDADWILRAVAAKGFRAPSPYELWSSYGNPGFQPEESRSFELGAERVFAAGSLRATVFDTKVEDQILFDSNTFLYYQVDGSSRSKGLELAGTMDLARGWSLFGAYTYTDATVDDGANTRPAARAPRHNLTLGAEGPLADRLTARLSLSHVADLRDEYVDYASFPYATTQVKLDDYTLANLALRYELTETAQAWLRIENLFDTDYQTARNYAQPGRVVSLGVGLRF
ncbi:TonB-dependent receptor plug domain-containing protein [Rhodobacter maris]|uniref:Vitamin B12 transporter n=1 Tax=Rhodobacter maris TaxID=446682 RepID=A0A285RIZ2_9RHOB|nr:TonB-dependent receptor [Rhodobacter maris]SOB93668.1 vitamin B12 transporter [Rhodobacter maris]